MPYIQKAARRPACLQGPITAGEVNYLATRAALRFLEDRSEADGRITYAALNEVIGALHCAADELYRRLGGPLEDAAIARNGDLKEYETVLSRIPGR